MSDDALQAACCLAGANAEVTVEELQVLRGLATAAGLERGPFDARVAKIRDDDDLKQENLDLVKSEAEETMRKLIGLAHRDEIPGEGHVTMLLWRIATSMEISPERFDEMLAAAESAG